jgi:hypothetical protein
MYSSLQTAEVMEFHATEAYSNSDLTNVPDNIRRPYREEMEDVTVLNNPINLTG